MKIRNCHLSLFAFSACLVWVLCLSAQDQPGSQDNSSKSLSPKELKKRQKGLFKELSPLRGRHLARFFRFALQGVTRSFFDLSEIHSAAFRPLSLGLDHQGHTQR